MRTSATKTGKKRRVSMFISHKVARHELAARRIKTLLQARTERLDVFICEDIQPGSEWEKRVTEQIASSNILLVLWPGGASADQMQWVEKEIASFRSVRPDGHLLVLKAPSDPIPDAVKDRQVLNATSADLRELLEHLYKDSTYTGTDGPLNDRLTYADIKRDAEEIEEAHRGVVVTRSEVYKESFAVETVDTPLTCSEGLRDAMVRAPQGCGQTLDWTKRSFYWKELCARAEEDRGKGTFWVSEIEQAILDVAQQKPPGVMTSTFRGRGALGRIFKPQLERVDFVGDRAARFHFAFHEVLVPELVRGKGEIGDVFNLLRIVARVRWEVLDPFLVNRFLARSPAMRLNDAQERELIGQVTGSLRVIESEADRHNIFAELNAFSDTGSHMVSSLLEERESIHAAIKEAIRKNDFGLLMNELKRGLVFNSTAMEKLAERFLQLVRDDRENIDRLTGAESTLAKISGQ